MCLTCAVLPGSCTDTCWCSTAQQPVWQPSRSSSAAATAAVFWAWRAASRSTSTSTSYRRAQLRSLQNCQCLFHFFCGFGFPVYFFLLLNNKKSVSVFADVLSLLAGDWNPSLCRRGRSMMRSASTSRWKERYFSPQPICGLRGPARLRAKCVFLQGVLGSVDGAGSSLLQDGEHVCHGQADSVAGARVPGSAAQSLHRARLHQKHPCRQVNTSNLSMMFKLDKLCIFMLHSDLCDVELCVGSDLK